MTEKILTPPEFSTPRVAEPLALHPRAVGAQDRRNRGEGFGVVDGGGFPVQAEGRRERRLEARFALFAFEGFEQRGFLAADVGAGAEVVVQVEIKTGAEQVFAEETGVSGFGEGGLHALVGFLELAADVVVAHGGAHGVAADDHSLNERVGVVAQDVAVFAGAGFAFVGVAHHVFLPRRGARHEVPFDARRKARAAAPAQVGGFHDLDDRRRVEAFAQHFFEGGIAAGFAVRRQGPAVVVLVGQADVVADAHAVESRLFHRWSVVVYGQGAVASRIRSMRSGVRFS